MESANPLHSKPRIKNKNTQSMDKNKLKLVNPELKNSKEANLSSAREVVTATTACNMKIYS
jgi:hypothetical protein